jgi:hypothetical protein
MSLSAISTALSTALPAVGFHPHGHRRGALPDKAGTSGVTSGTSSSTSGITIGQMPVGAATPLFNNILQSLQRTVGAQAAVTAANPAGTTSAAPATASSTTGAPATIGTAADVQAFMHALFQALKQDGTASSGAAAPVSAAGPAAGSGPYQSNLLSSLQTLVRQVGPGAAGTPVTANLNAAYQTLVTGAGPGTAAASAAPAGLQGLLSSLLQNLQTGGVHPLSGIGNNVNANA